MWVGQQPFGLLPSPSQLNQLGSRWKEDVTMSNYAEFAKDARAIADRLELIPDGWSGEDDLQTLQGEVQDLADALGDALEELHQAADDSAVETTSDADDEDGDE